VLVRDNHGHMGFLVHLEREEEASSGSGAIIP